MQYTRDYINSLVKTISDIPNIETLKGKSVLITGASGLIGSAIVDVLLMLDFEIKVNAGGRSFKKIKERFKYWDNRYCYFEYDASKTIDKNMSFDYIIHCASNAHPAVYAEKPVETILTNIIGTNNILDYAVKHNVKRVLYVSSSEVYGNKEDSDLYTENKYYSVDILNPRACYPSGKRACETLCASYIKEYGVDVVIARPGHVYGPTITNEDTRAHAQFARDAVCGRNIVMKSDGMQLRSYCYVLDCVSALLTILIRGKTGEAYNISNKNSIVTIREFAEAHAKTVGKNIVFDMANSKEKEGYNMMSCSALSSYKLEVLGWKGRFNIEYGVRETINALKF